MAENTIRKRMEMNRVGSIIVAVAGFVCCWSNAATATTLTIEIKDEQNRPLPCRMLVRSTDRKCVVPKGAVVLIIGTDRWFMSTGRSMLDVPRGEFELRVERGLEYVRIKTKIDAAGDETTYPFVLRRWVDMSKRGYRCGENHLLVDAKQLGPMLAAEGLDFGSMIQWWNQRLKPVPPGKGHVRRLEFAGRSVPSSMYDVEVEHAWGVVCLQNLPAEHSVKDIPARPNLDHIKHARKSGVVVSYQGGYSPEIAVDALLGYVDIVHVVNNNFHMHRFQPRRRYSNLLSVPGFPEYENSALGMMHMNTETYYRLLNWGLHLSAGAGTSCGVKQVPVGYNRAYVRCEKNASIAAFYRAWAAGKNFVTNGPMLFLETSAGRKPGDTVALPAGGGTIRLRVSVIADQPLRSIEVIVNGKVVKQIDARGMKTSSGEFELPVKAGSWIAARAMARDTLLTDEELARYANGKSQQPTRLRFAHTSPIYVTVAGKGTAVPRSIDEGFQMLEAFTRFARKHSSSEHLPGILEAIDKARAKLQERLDQS